MRFNANPNLDGKNRPHVTSSQSGALLANGALHPDSNVTAPPVPGEALEVIPRWAPRPRRQAAAPRLLAPGVPRRISKSAGEHLAVLRPEDTLPHLDRAAAAGRELPSDTRRLRAQLPLTTVKPSTSVDAAIEKSTHRRRIRASERLDVGVPVNLSVTPSTRRPSSPPGTPRSWSSQRNPNARARDLRPWKDANSTIGNHSTERKGEVQFSYLV